MKILVVDDNADAADTLAEVLTMDAHEVRACYDEATALTLAVEGRPHVVVLDIGMPGQGGHALAREIRQALPAATIIALTGFSRPEDVQRSLDAGIDEHWIKPLDSEMLARALAATEQRLGLSTRAAAR